MTVTEPTRTANPPTRTPDHPLEMTTEEEVHRSARYWRPRDC